MVLPLRIVLLTRQENWHTTTLIGALRGDGSTACMSIEDATDAMVFAAFIQQVLLPTCGAGMWS